MPADLSISEIAMFGTIAVGVVIGLFRGLSGGLGTLGGIAAGIAAGWFLLDPLTSFVTARGWFQQPLALRGAVLVADGVAGLVVFGLVRRMIEKFVKFLVPGTLNVILGGVAGGALAFAVWRAGEMAIAFFQGGAQGGGAA